MNCNLTCGFIVTTLDPEIGPWLLTSGSLSNVSTDTVKDNAVVN